MKWELSVVETAGPKRLWETLRKKIFSVLPDNKKSRIWMLCGVIFAVALASVIAVACLNRFSLELTLEGDREITAQVGLPFEDPGVHAEFGGTVLLRKPVSVEVQKSGAVDTADFGTYTITYTAEYVLHYLVGQKTFRQSESRTVHVVDTKAPEITLVSAPEYYTLPGHAYAEEGFSATDNRDGDITHLVEREEQDGVVHYKVADRCGNVAEITRKIVYDDPVAPELTLVGSENMQILAGNGFFDPGWKAVDNCDGDITAKVQVTGWVDHETPGTYTLEYTAKDDHNNIATATRRVQVLEKEEQFAGVFPVAQPGVKLIYLTFDDGPNVYTERLLNVLDRYGVKATFFVVDSNYLHLLPRMAESGHTVAIHSKTHNYYQIYASEEAYFEDLQQMRQIIEDYTGTQPMLVRFPGGSSNSVSGFNKGIMTRLTAMLRQQGYRYFDWSVDSGDVSSAQTADQVFQNVVNQVSGRSVSVVLQHDIMGHSVDAVERIIRWGLANGYTFLPLGASSPACEHGIHN